MSSNCDRLDIDGDHRKAVCANQGQPAGAARQCELIQPAVPECCFVRGRTWMQVARASETLWQLAHIYTRMNRWSKSGAMDRVFEKLQLEQIVSIRIEAFSLDSTSVKVHPDGTGALKKTDRSQSVSPAADGPPRFIWLPRMLGPQ